MTECECVGCRPHQRYGIGPAALEATRDGQRITVCTRCILSTDTERVVIATDPAPLLAYDASGAHNFCPDLCPRSGPEDEARDLLQGLADLAALFDDDTE